jgi:hypothetical protein
MLYPPQQTEERIAKYKTTSKTYFTGKNVLPPLLHMPPCIDQNMSGTASNPERFHSSYYKRAASSASPNFKTSIHLFYLATYLSYLVTNCLT